MERAWVGTGETQHVPGDIDRIPEFDKRTGEHLWAIFTVYRWGGPTVETPTLDMENLLSVLGPGCFYCNQEWSERLATRRCPGVEV